MDRAAVTALTTDTPHPTITSRATIAASIAADVVVGNYRYRTAI